MNIRYIGILGIIGLICYFVFIKGCSSVPVSDPNCMDSGFPTEWQCSGDRYIVDLCNNIQYDCMEVYSEGGSCVEVSGDAPHCEQLQPNCYDSDSSVLTLGFVIQDGAFYWDYCDASQLDLVYEYVCSSTGYAIALDKYCPSGYSCKNGKCSNV